MVKELSLKICWLVALFILCIAPTSAQEIPFFKEYSIDLGMAGSTSYFLSLAEKPDSPLLLFIQGSGCEKVIKQDEQGTSTNIFNLFEVAKTKEFNVLVVNKPFSNVLPLNSTIDSQKYCSEEFHQHFTVGSWVAVLDKAMTEALSKLTSAPRDVVLFGISEGAGIASQLALKNNVVTHIIFTGGSGSSQLYDFVLEAYSKCFDKSVCINKIYDQVEKINKSPNSHDKFAWGHSYKRWASFFELKPYENLLKTEAKIYLVFGTSDESTPALSQELIVANLMAARKESVTVKRLPDMTHSLNPVDSQDFSYLAKEIAFALDWYRKTKTY